MRILLTNDAEKIAGGENYVLHLAEGLSNKGHDVLIAPLKSSELEEESKRRGFETTGINFGSHGKEFNAITELVKSFKGKKIDIVHSNSNLDRTIAAVAGKIINARNISSVHSCLSINRNMVHSFRNKFLIDHFTPVGYSTKKIMVETDKISPGKITVVHIGIPESKIIRTEAGRNRIRNEFSIKNDEVVIGTLSRLVEFKGHKYLIEAFNKLNPEVNKFTKLLIVGDGELKQNLMSQAEEYGLKDKIIFTGERNDISDVLSAFDIFSQFSIDAGGETFPVAIIEALASGLPVIGSNVGDIEHLIDNSKNGYLVEPENLVQFTQAITNLIEDKSLRNEMGKESHIKFIKEFTLNTMIENMELVYNKVLKLND